MYMLAAANWNWDWDWGLGLGLGLELGLSNIPHIPHNENPVIGMLGTMEAGFRDPSIANDNDIPTY